MLEVATDSLTECLQCNTALFVGAYVFGLGDFRRSLQDRKKIASDFTEGEDCCTPFGLQRDLRKRFSEAELVGLGWVLSQLAFPPSNSSIARNGVQVVSFKAITRHKLLIRSVPKQNAQS